MRAITKSLSIYLYIPPKSITFMSDIKKAWSNFWHGKRGFVDPTAIVSIAVIMVTIIVTVVIYYSIAGGVTLSSPAGQSQLNNTTSAATGVFSLMNVIPIVAIAGLIIALLLGYLVYNRRK